MALTKTKKRTARKMNKTEETAPPAAATTTTTTEAPPPAPESNGNGSSGKNGRPAESGGKRTRKSAPFKILHQQQGFFFRPKKFEAAVAALPEEIRAKFQEELGTPKLKTIYTEIDTPDDINSTGAGLKHIKKSAESLQNRNLVVAQFRDKVRIHFEKKVIEKKRAKLQREGDPKPAAK